MGMGMEKAAEVCSGHTIQEDVKKNDEKGRGLDAAESNATGSNNGEWRERHRVFLRQHDGDEHQHHDSVAQLNPSHALIDPASALAPICGVGDATTAFRPPFSRGLRPLRLKLRLSRCP